MGLFKIMKGKDDFTYFINNKSKLMHPDEYKDYYRFAGQVIAKALFEKVPI